MKRSAKKPAVLMLQDGTIISGRAFGYEGITGGEICFNTGMTGYQEVFTDPSYYGQVLIMNTAHVGNYGTAAKDVESDAVQVKGIICRNLEEKFSRFMAEESLEDYLVKNKIVAIDQVDTRSLVNKVRTQGAQNCVIANNGMDIVSIQEYLQALPNMNGLELASTVSTTEPYMFGDESAPLKVAVMDFGVKRNILQCMADRGCYIKVFPAKTSFNEVQSFEADGYFLSNGPGDPAPMNYALDTVHSMINSGKPVFGICLGHQLIALANGIETFKMHHGHRGLNHPVKNLITGRSEITTQNHGFGVKRASLLANDNVQVTHVNLNDDSIEGIRMKNKPVFSVQYHPESTPGPHDSRYLFDEFIDLIQQHK